MCGPSSNRRVCLAEIEPAIKDKSLVKEIPRCQRFISRPALDVLLTAHGTDEKKKRDEELRKAHFETAILFQKSDGIPDFIMRP